MTASKNGYFINKGYKPDNQGNEILNYDSNSALFKTFIDLLKHASPHFASHIDQQGYIYQKTGKKTALATFISEQSHQEDSHSLEETGIEDPRIVNAASAKAGKKRFLALILEQKIQSMYKESKSLLLNGKP